MNKISWNDFHEATQHELRKTYKLDYGKEGNKKLEKAIQAHLDGASAKEKREFYDKFYRRK